MGRGWINGLKEANSAKKGQLISKLAREIQVAAKLGGPDPAGNARLRMALDVARKAHVSGDTIDRAIKKGAGLLEGAAQIEEVLYEGFGPHGVGVLVECQTDNKNRTVPEVRLIFKSHGGAMGESGSVAWMFEHVGMIEGEKAGQFDPEEEAIEAGANEVEKHEGKYTFYVPAKELDHVRTALTKRGWTVSTAELAYKAKNSTELTPEQVKEVEAFLAELDGHDDTHRIYATLA